jgi:hypothetical protein
VIVKMIRVKLHPYNWLAVVRLAVTRYKGNGQSLIERRKAADLQKLFDAKFDPDFNVANPYLRANSRQLATMKKRNEEILAKDPVYGRLQGPEPDGRGGFLAGYQEIPNPNLSTFIDMEGTIRDFCVQAVTALASDPETDNAIAQGIVDSIDALRGAEEVEIDTERILPSEHP